MDGVVICECAGRDGLQHEPGFVPTSGKVALLTRVADAGFTRIEATSYSHPGHVPAFADASEVLAALPRRPGVAFKVTCPNVRAVQRAIADQDAGYGAEEISLLVSATESHSTRNLRVGRAGQWDRVAEMARLARGRFRLVGVISMAFGCPFEGAVDPDVVYADFARFAELGADLVTLGDTAGLGTPAAMTEVFGTVAAQFPRVPAVAHMHDSRGTAIANCVAAFAAGCRHFDASLGGIGGHPAQIQYGEGNTGNTCTEDLVNLFEAMGVPTGIDLDALLAASRACEELLGRELHSRVARAGWSRLITTPSAHSIPA